MRKPAAEILSWPSVCVWVCVRESLVFRAVRECVCVCVLCGCIRGDHRERVHCGGLLSCCIAAVDDEAAAVDAVEQHSG